ncbi:uncharacterized protein LOC135951073 [Calliphora vicina]|uniref:uncharacterized protein LOC135951073 n=1 Tax=Calliphora vicina TaxID=7373 RepID=UPI00325A625A
MRKHSYRAILNKAQRCACLGITGALGSTPQAALDIILNLLHIENYVESVAARNLLRLSDSSLVKPLRIGHTMILYEAGLIGHDIIPSGISDYKIATFSFGASPPVEFPTRDKWVGSDQLFDGCAVFTDGSKMDSGTLAGVYLVDYDIKRSYRLSNECSVFQAEIFAIWKATELIKAHVNRGAEVTIYVDSQAALKALECHLIHSNLVEDCRRALEELLVHYSVRLCWVPEHCDIQGNEVADEQDRHGSDMDHDTRERDVKPPICYYYMIIYEKFRDYTNQSWVRLQSVQGLMAKTECEATGTLIELDRYNLRILVGVITGYCSIGAFKGKWDNVTQDFCRVCGDAEELETVEHIMCNCQEIDFWTNLEVLLAAN